MIKKLIRNARTALRHPDYLPQYVRYEWQRLGGGALIRMPWGDDIGGFVNFSEYRSTPHCLDSGEITALETIAERLQAERTFNSDAYVLDVGANLGVTALYLSHLFPENPLRCFEPAPTTYAALLANVERNHRRAVLCEQLAVSDTNGHIYSTFKQKVALTHGSVIIVTMALVSRRSGLTITARSIPSGEF